MQNSGIVALFATAQQFAAQPQVALALYRDYLAQHPDDPLLHAVYFNQAVLLASQNEVAAAAQAFGEAIRRAPGFIPPYINLGALYEKLGAIDHALDHWKHAIDRLAAVSPDNLTYKLTAQKQTARLLEDRKQLARAEAILQEMLLLQPHQRDVLQHWVALRQRQCRWPLLQPLGPLDLVEMKRRLAPLSLATYTDDPMLQLANSWSYSRRDIGYPEQFNTLEDFALAPREGRRLRIGYLSSDLREHAIGFLTADMYRLHDRERFEIFVYYCGIAAEDTTKQRIRDQVEHWHDITPLDDDAAMALMRQHGIDILVDVNGHTRGARTALLARRPAPVIVNWLGFPASMGSPYHHYIIADDFIIPDGHERFFTETVLRLPCYQPNDRNRVLADSAPTRAEAGLPDDATVFCSFNGTQKVTPFVFARWMAILRGVPGSVLWLLKSSEEVDVRLRELATEHGIDPGRLVFAPLANNRDHVARYPLADLFLDTAPYGAHTTASDALWMGVPVLTTPGQSFASRVCGSLVRAAGLPELLCVDGEDYVRRAIALGQDRAKLAVYRDRLLANRQTSVLFDTELFVKEFEALFEGMWEDVMAGRLPQPDLTNLETYLEIGVTLDHESVEFGPDFETAYRDAIARRHRFTPFAPDHRLWPAGEAA
ncbi:O-linked N-acetylglucosamine transferase, SPINDLY family protein [Roseomonas sp. USHLN139]|uniref:O-linked N-acetylglucosamine transferase, SPINDLY family protein n=1 Tax=Roseomonas sp. USHLN139 TaxID=3081298 RepID=UPI003B01A970